ncbi:MAG: glycosyltransferase [Myxococcota bacterium]
MRILEDSVSRDSTMVILNVADPRSTIAPCAVDGSEQLIKTLDSALAREGHSSRVVARFGTAVRGVLYPLPLIGGRHASTALVKAQECIKRAIDKALRESAVDVIHVHSAEALQCLPDVALPTFLTLHQPLADYPEELFENAGKRLELVCVSEDQRRRFGRDDVPLDIIPLGVELQRFAPRAAKQSYAVLMGPIFPASGIELALRAARAAGVAVRLSGQVLPVAEHEEYFDQVILPLLDDERQFIGPLDGAGRRELLARARVLMVPSQFDAATSIHVMESLASGTPVIATRRGALASLVEDGITGWLADDVEAMAVALRRIDEISGAACRAAAEDRFDVRRTRGAYLARYTRARLGKPAGRDGRRRRGELRVAERVTDGWLRALRAVREGDEMEPRMGIEPTTC